MKLKKTLKDSFETLEKNTLLHLKMVLKYNIFMDLKLLDRLIKSLDDFVIQERNLYEELLNSIPKTQY
jgi:hypothetical protein